jgi:hypothetical protein
MRVDMPKKWWERSEADKRRIDNWVAANAARRQEYQRVVKVKTRNRNGIKKGASKDTKVYEHPIVSRIISVKDTPRSLTLQFLKWQEKKDESVI